MLRLHAQTSHVHRQCHMRALCVQPQLGKAVLLPAYMFQIEFVVKASAPSMR